MSTHHDLNQFSNHELMAMTTDLDDMHHDQALPAMTTAAEEWCEILRDQRAEADSVERRRAGRRTFLLGAAATTAAGLVLAACGSSSKSSAKPKSTKGLPAGTAADLSVAAMASSLENLGVYAYNTGIKAATSGALGKIPPAVPVFALTARGQHVDHGHAWNSILTSAGFPAVTETDPALTPAVNTAFKSVTTVADLANLANYIENIAAQTYQAGVAALSEPSAISVSATIQPVEMQHSAILYYVLGQYPGIQGTATNKYASGTPLAFSPTTLARPNTDVGTTL